MIGLAGWQQLGLTDYGRLSSMKQYYEIQTDPEASTVYMPVYLRRRVTLITLIIEIDYLDSLPTVLSPAEGWFLNLIGGADYINEVIWKEPGDAVTLHTVKAPDNDGHKTNLSGNWMVDSKEISATGDGSTTVVITFRNEGPWVTDKLR